jgi:hypothetical protein
MKITGPQVISEIREKLQFGVGRHLYGALGGYAQLADFEETALAHAQDPQGRPFPEPVNLNRELLARIGDEDLRKLIQAEARRPQAIQRRLGQELDALLASLLEQHPFLILKQLELLFAYGLDLSVFRTRATNQNHILLLLPGARHGDHIALFHEAGSRFQRTLPPNLIADNHLWELKDD